MSRPLSAIARDVKAAWPKPYFGAVPYLNAMMSMGDIREPYGYDSGESIVVYFLGNAHAFRGPAARALKAELNAQLKAVRP